MPKLTKEQEERFDKLFNHDNPNGKAIVLISTEDGVTSQRPIQDEMKSFIASEIDLAIAAREKEIKRMIIEYWEKYSSPASGAPDEIQKECMDKDCRHCYKTEAKYIF